MTDAPLSLSFSYTVRMRSTDAAGVVFFARWFEIAHDAYEDFMAARGRPLPPDLAHTTPILPIVHASSDYKASIALNDRITVTVRVEELRRRAFTLVYEISKPDGTACGRLTTVHVAVDRIGGRPVELPPDLKRALGG